MNQFSKIAVGFATAAGLTTGVYFLSSSKTQEEYLVSQAIPASASVSASGMLTWSMDIEVPPGIQNVQPALSINYSSQNVSGLLGTGFDLEGLSEITRTGATEAQDGFFGGVGFTKNDRFDLDGNRLMVMKGVYGAASSVYHTQLESWSKVVAVGQSGSGPQTFQLWSKTGMYFEYGNTTDSRVLALPTNSPSSFAAGSVRQWLVNKCRDLHGNTLTVSYTQTPPDSLGNALTTCSGQGQSYPLRIDYTANDTVKALRSVQFIYEARPDSGVCFVGGAKFSTRARMTAIRTYLKDGKGDSVLVREVRIAYQKDAPLLVSRMAALEVRGGNCGYTPTTFNWSQGQDTLISKAVSWNGNGNNTGFVGDFNGDGKNDILQSNNHVYFGTATGFSDAGSSGLMYNTSMNIFVGDFNGDGISDFFAASSQGGTIYYYNAQTRTFSSNKSVSGLLISSGCYPNKCVWQGDFNGDGLSDLCSAMGTSAYVNFGNATNGLNAYKQQNNLSIYKGNTYAADFNGDGLTDIFSCNPSTGYLTFSNWSDSTGFRSSITIPNMNFTISSSQSYTWVADYNGDGLADILARGTDSKYRIYYANGNGFQAAKIITINLSATAVWPADFNHDGLMDFFVASTSNGQIYYSNGIDFSTEDPVNYAFQPQYTWLGDFNGDGLTDLFNCYSKQTFYGGSTKSSNQTINQQGSLITGIANGIGSVFTATYKPITDSTVYDAGSSTPTSALEGQRVINAYNAFPLSPVQNQLNGVISIQQAMYVVSDWSETDGRGAAYPYQCEYGGAKYDMTGYGFLGYAFSQTTNVSSGAVSKTFNLQDFPFTNMTDSSVLTDGSGNVYQSVSYHWDSVSILGASGVHCYEVLQSVQNSYLYNKTSVACKSQEQYWYDAFGNARLTAKTGNVAEPNTLWNIATYSNDTANWQLGFVTSSRQSSDSAGTNPLSAIKISYTPQRARDSLYIWYSTTNTWLSRTFGYDVFGNQTMQTSYAGDTSKLVYEGIYHTYPYKTILPRTAHGVSLQTVSVYDPAYGQVVQSIDPNGNVFEYVYDGLGRFKESWIPDSTGVKTLVLQANYLPDSIGFFVQQISVHDWAGQLIDTSTIYYDGLSRKFQTRYLGWNNQSVFTSQDFNSTNQITATSWSHFATETPVWWRNYYDPAGRTVRFVSPYQTNDSTVTKVSYLGLETQVTRAAGALDSTVSKYIYAYYNGKTRVTNFLNASGATTTYTWDLLGRINTAIDPDGNKTAAGFNSLGMNDWYYSVSFDTTFFYYDPIQQTKKTVDAQNDTAWSLFDNLGRTLTSKASRTTPITYLYDQANVKNGLGNLCSVTQDNGATHYAYSYDALGNIISEMVQLDGKTWQQQAVYNPDLSIASLVYPNKIEAFWQYNRAGQPLLLNQKNQNETQNIVTVNGVDAKGNWLNYTYGNGVTTGKGYYTDGTLQHILVQNTGKTNYLSKNYGWSEHGLILSIDDLLNDSLSEAYTYNPTGRLLHVDSKINSDSFAYNAAGNLIWADSITFNYANYQVNSGVYRGKTIYAAQYNRVGQMSNRSLTEQEGTKNYRYTYNGFAQMDSVFRNDSLVYVYTYDYTGSRNRTRDVLKGSVNYQVVDSYSQFVSPTKQVESCNFSMGGVVFATLSESTSFEYYSYNQNSSTVLVTNGKGDVMQRLSYSPYGKFKPELRDTARAQYKFNGKEYNEGSGLYYFESRFYDPFTSRFVSPDDQLGGGLTTPDALNNYAFAANSPITLSDPSGHMPKGGKLAKEVVKIATIASLEATEELLTDGGATPMLAAVDGKLLVDGTKKEGSVLVKRAASAMDFDSADDTSEELLDDSDSDSDVSEEVSESTSSMADDESSSDDGGDEESVSDEESESDDDDTNDQDYNQKLARHSIPQRIRNTVYNDALDRKTGKVFCARGCGTELMNTKTYLHGHHYTIDWHMGHKTGYEYVGLKELYEANKITDAERKAETIDPRHYQPECPPCNHKGEQESKNRPKIRKNYMESIWNKRKRIKTSYYQRSGYPYYILPRHRRDGSSRLNDASTQDYRVI
ncbi:MAG: FG-GAP-like repeat-containing protein [Bacteroidia bacterium]